MDERRADPDQLLNQLKRDEANQNRGLLKIFFGYAAGVGKTYAMLEAAHTAKNRGMDVVVGYVEPHTRPDTMAMLEGLDQLPCLSVEHKGLVLREFDLDGAIARHPKLILVDELAHTNAPGCRHAKRYQDIEELLKAGINVYTTVNVQHIESLNDRVAAITGITVRERIPDRIFDSAGQVELVDIEPGDLMERLNAGKVYAGEQAQRALGNFFDVKNLTALREIALRQCADRMNRISERTRLAGREDYVTDEHILVCLSSSPTNAKIIRTAARMAAAFRGGFTALFVETSDFPAMREEDKARLRENIHLAQQLGAAIETVFGDDIPQQIAEFARISGVSKIVMGRRSAQRKFIWSKPPLTEQLTAAAPNLDIYIIPDRRTLPYRVPRVKQPGKRLLASDVLKSFGMLAAATLAGFLFHYLGFSEANIITVYILSVVVTSVITTQRAYSLISSVVSVLTFNYFFTDPRFSLNAYDAGYPATFLIMFAAAFLTGTLAVRLKQQARQAARTGYRTKILLDTSQLLQKGKSRAEIAEITAGQLVKLLKRTVAFFLVEEERLSSPLVYPAEDSPMGAASAISENEKAVAAWVFKNNKRAGATTDTLGNAKFLYLAVRVNDTVYGVVGVEAENDPLGSFENSVMLSILGECALALESEHAIRQREMAAVLAKNEQLRANLLRSISHDLRTPLTAISGNAGILLESSDKIGEPQKMQLYTDIYDDSLWLINLVENLLAVTKIEDGSMHLKLTAELVDEVIAEALRHVTRKKAEHIITVKPTEDVLLAMMDTRLIVQVLINLIDNAVKYTPPGSEITIASSREGDMVSISVSDNGAGIPDEAKKRIFDMFYTVKNEVADSRRSLGLGLALCKSIVSAHGGEISVSDMRPAGTTFRFTLPVKEVVLRESIPNSDC